jgi:multicomponent Na+:H+ antiporter subunit D
MTLIDHLPILVVIVPLMAAPVGLLIRRPRAVWFVALATSWFCFAASAVIAHQVWTAGTIDYELGGWAPPWGIAYRIDLLNSFVLLIVSGIAAIVLSYARLSVEKEIPASRQYLFYSSLMLCLSGLLGITTTGDVFNLFVFLEISSLSSYALISMGSDRRALSAAFQYLVMGSIGASFILIGIGFMYMMTGTLNMVDLAKLLPEVSDTRTVRAGLAFLTVGTGLKLALFPLHLWLPNAYAFAPSVVSAFLAATATKVAVYALLRFLLGIFGLEFSLIELPLYMILLGLGSIGILSASLVAVYQQNIKRMLAYSSVAQIGYIALGIGLATSNGITAATLHLFNHALMKGALFLALGAVMYRVGAVRIGDFAGLGRRMPLTMAAILIAGLSLIGIPGTVGFISKWYLVLGTLEKGMWPLAVLVLVASILALVYVWRVVEAAYFSEPAPDSPAIKEAPLSMLIPIWVLVAANIYFGIDTDLTVGMVERATSALLGAVR